MLKIKPNGKTLFFLALLPILLTGCWDVVDIERRELVTGLALDLTEENQVLLTAQIPISKFMLPTTDNPSGERTFYTISAQGVSTLEAFAKFKTKTSGHLETLKTNVLIIGEKIATQGITPYLDTICRMPKFPINSYLLLSKSESGALLQKELATKTMPTFYIRDFFNLTTKRDTVYSIRLWDFLYRLDNPAIDPYLPVLEYSAKEKIFLPKGLAALRNDTFAAYLTPEETRIFGLLSTEGAGMNLSVEWREGRIISVSHVDSKVIYQWLPPQEIKIYLKATGYLMEETGATLPLTWGHLAEMEEVLAKTVKDQAEQLLDRLQAVNSDIIGLGLVVKAKHRGKWTEEYWRSLYPKLQIEVEVDFTLTRTGLLN